MFDVDQNPIEETTMYNYTSEDNNQIIIDTDVDDENKNEKICNKENEENSSKKNYHLSSWDVQFRKLMMTTKNDDDVEKAKEMSDLADNFFAAASTFCKMIVAEQHVVDKDKKIRPMDVGGVAGGTKFSAHGLFFKYPVDTLIDKNKQQWF